MSILAYPTFMHFVLYSPCDTGYRKETVIVKQFALSCTRRLMADRSRTQIL